MRSFTFVFVLFAISTTAQAGNLLSMDELTPERFPEATERLETLMEPGQVHGQLGEPLKRLVLHRLSQIEAQLNNPHARERRQQLTLQRQLKSVNDLLATSRTSADSEMFCRRQQISGSRVYQVVCHDRAELEEKAFETKNSFYRPVGCSRGLGCGGG